MTLDEHCRGANAFDVGAIIVMVAMMDAAITYLLVVIILLFFCGLLFAPWGELFSNANQTKVLAQGCLLVEEDNGGAK